MAETQATAEEAQSAQEAHATAEQMLAGSASEVCTPAITEPPGRLTATALAVVLAERTSRDQRLTAENRELRDLHGALMARLTLVERQCQGRGSELACLETSLRREHRAHEDFRRQTTRMEQRLNHQIRSVIATQEILRQYGDEMAARVSEREATIARLEHDLGFQVLSVYPTVRRSPLNPGDNAPAIAAFAAADAS